MKKVGTLLMWLLAGFMVSGAMVYAPSLASGVLLLCAVIAAPIKPLQELIASKNIKGPVKGGLVTILFLTACFLAPVDQANSRSAGAGPSQEVNIYAVDTLPPAVQSTSPSPSVTPAPESSSSLSAMPAPESPSSPSATPAPESPSSSSAMPAPESSSSSSAMPAPESPSSPSATPAPESPSSPSATPAPESSSSPSATPAPESPSSPSATPAPESSSSPPVTPAPESSPSPSVMPAPESSPSLPALPTQASTGNAGSGTGAASNFDTWNNPDQQKTSAAWVLNTSSKKIHYPSCSMVKKIAPQNYGTSNLSQAELIAQGYSVCKRCH